MSDILLVWGRRALRVLFAVWVGMVASGAGWAQTVDVDAASAAFAEAKALSDKDAGQLWGRPLYGPLIFVDPETRFAVANEADGKGVLQARDGAWAGTLPPELVPANTAFYWEGNHWTMVMWPLPEHSQPRRRLLAHEMYHRLQDDLKLPGNAPQNPQLDTLDGRYWLQLEWRALGVALATQGAARTAAIRDALAFRAARHEAFAGSSQTERQLEMNEGLAEYTGYALFAPDRASAQWRLEADLASPQAKTFVRSFAYTSGPAYGMLLDELAAGWRGKLTAASDLGQVMAAAVSGGGTLPDAKGRALVYGGAGLRVSETERAAQTSAQQARYRKLLVEGPTLLLKDAGKFNFSFDPNEVIPLPGAGNVNPTIEVTDVWGSLKAEQGALMANDFKSVTVSAPVKTEGAKVSGAGWVLELEPGWRVAKGADGRFAIERQ